MSEGYNVELWVFDISQGMASTFSRSILGQQIDGIWHTSIVVYGTEYLYGGGIQGVAPGTTAAGASPTQKVNLGHTPKSMSQFHTYLRSVEARFSPSKYDLLKHNCNNFTDEAAKFLLGKPIPEWITGLPEQALSSPLGAMIRPWLENLQSQLVQALPGMQGMFVQAYLPAINPAFDKEFKPVRGMDVDSKDEKEETFRIGDRVMLCGLKAKDYNGKIGIIDGIRLNTGRWPVKLEMDSSVKAFRPSNLKYAPRLEKPKPCPYETLRGLKPISNTDDNEERYKRLIVKHGKLTREEVSCLGKLVKFIKEENTVAVPEEYINFFKGLFMKVPVKALFSLFAMFRNFVTKKNVAGFDFDIMKKVQERIPEKNCTVYLLYVTACANLVVNGIKDSESAIEIAATALDHENEHVRTAGALLSYNIALTVPEDADESQISLFCSLVEVVKKEKNTSVLNRSLLSIGVLIREDETLAHLMNQMEVSFDGIKAAGTSKTEKIVQDLLQILEVSKNSDELSI